MRKLLQIITILLSLTVFAANASAGPAGDAIQEAGEMVGAAEDRIGEVLAGTKELVEEIVGEVARNVQAHLNTARDHATNGDKQKARAHALAARYEIRKVSKRLGLKLPALTKQEIAAKAGKTPAFKAHLAKLPSGKALLTGSCKLPNYGQSCK